jgi:menaquinol-cytochrome c reductase cytochrome b subunit
VRTAPRAGRRMRRARAAFVGQRSRVAAFLARAGGVRMPAGFGGTRWLSVTALVLLAIQMLTGVLLALYYYPEPVAAYDSVRFLLGEVSIGWLVRGVHHWAADLLVVAVALHVGAVYMRRAYVRPRDWEWAAGTLLLCTVLMFRFTGRLLPWDDVGHAVTTQGLHLIESIPLAGRLLATWLRGGDAVGVNTLSRFFTTHVILLPWAGMALLWVHARQLRAHGLSRGDARGGRGRGGGGHGGVGHDGVGHGGARPGDGSTAGDGGTAGDGSTGGAP